MAKNRVCNWLKPGVRPTIRLAISIRIGEDTTNRELEPIQTIPEGLKTTLKN